jgi:ABC-type glycerol-3-phosphate transport system substrate-binding protein
VDITDILTESLNDYQEEKTIEDKLSDEQKDYYMVDGKYYAVPLFFAFQA